MMRNEMQLGSILETATSDRNRNMNAQREKVDDLCRDFHIYLWNGGMVAQHSYLITKRGDRKPQNIYLYL